MWAQSRNLSIDMVLLRLTQGSVIIMEATGCLGSHPWNCPSTVHAFVKFVFEMVGLSLETLHQRGQGHHLSP